jgi:hypothetical protein
LARWLKQERIDVLHSQVYNGHIYAILAGMLAGIPVLMHHSKTFSKARWRRYWTMRVLSHLAARHAALTSQTARDVSREFRIPVDEIAVLPNVAIFNTSPTDETKEQLRNRLGIPDGPPIVGTAASLFPQKNHRVTLRAARLLADAGTPVRFTYSAKACCATNWRRKSSRSALKDS